MLNLTHNSVHSNETVHIHKNFYSPLWDDLTSIQKKSCPCNINFLMVGPEASTLQIQKPLTSFEAVPVLKQQAIKVQKEWKKTLVFLTSTPDINEKFVSSSSFLPLDRKPSVSTG